MKKLKSQDTTKDRRDSAAKKDSEHLDPSQEDHLRNHNHKASMYNNQRDQVRAMPHQLLPLCKHLTMFIPRINRKRCQHHPRIAN